MKGQKGSMRNGNQKFRGCADCPTLNCYGGGCHHEDGIEAMEVLPSVHSTKPRWTPRGKTQ